MIVLINPNATAAMTQTMLETAQHAAPGLRMAGWTNHGGPAAIQGAADGDAATPSMLELVRKATRDRAQAIIIGCFDDTGLAQARQIADCPVIGIGQAAYHVAASSGRRFSVVTTLEASVPVLEQNIRAYHLTLVCARVRASGVPVLALETDPEAATAGVLAQARLAEQEDDIDCLALGCGGMVHLPEVIRRETRLIPIDGVRAATHMAAQVSGY